MKRGLHRVIVGTSYFIMPMLSADLADQISKGAEKIHEAPAQLHQLPTQLSTMFNSLNAKIPDIEKGIKKLDDAVTGITKAKTQVQQNAQAPDEIKTKIVTALSTLEQTLPTIKNVFVNLKNTMQGLVNTQTQLEAPINNLINQTVSTIQGSHNTPSVPNRLDNLSHLIRKGEGALQDLENAGNKVKKGFEDFGSDFKKAFHIK